MSDIFISYKREDYKTAKKFAEALERQGWSIWWDPRLRSGENFDLAIEKALKQAKCTIVLWSKRSVKSQYIRDEAIYALNKEKLLPVSIEDVTPPFRFTEIQTAKFQNWDGSDTSPEFIKLVEDIVSKIGLLPMVAENNVLGHVKETQTKSLEEKVQKVNAPQNTILKQGERVFNNNLNHQRQIRVLAGAAIGLFSLIFLLVSFWHKRFASGWGDFANYSNHEVNIICTVLIFLISPFFGILLKPNRSVWRGIIVGAGLGMIYWVIRGLLAWPTASSIENSEGFATIFVLAIIGGIVGKILSWRFPEQ